MAKRRRRIKPKTRAQLERERRRILGILREVKRNLRRAGEALRGR